MPVNLASMFRSLQRMECRRNEVSTTGVGRLEEHHIYFRIILHIADYFHSLLYN